MGGPWLVSMAMWWNCMRFVGEDGVRVGELRQLARTKTNLNGMVRWGYIVVAPDPQDPRPKPLPSNWLIRPTRKGRKAQQVWQPLFNMIESRWHDRFGTTEIDRLRDALWAVNSQFKIELPNCLPILGYGLHSKGPDRDERSPPVQPSDGTSLPLPALLARVLLAFVMEFEHKANLSLAISANVIRCLAAGSVKVRDLPVLSGVSKEAINMALGILEKGGLATVEVDLSGGRSKVIQLTPKGQEAWEQDHRLLATIEERWQSRFGADAIHNLRGALECLLGGPVFRGLDPYPDGWRASTRKPATLPHFPMVLHRGGFPDGS